MKKYLIPFFVVLFAMFLPSFGVDTYIAYIVRAIAGLAVIAYFWKQYKEIKAKFDPAAWLMGLGLILIWIGFDLAARHFGWNFAYQGNIADFEIFNPFNTQFPFILIAAKLIGMVIVAAVVEELFIRSFLIRFFVDSNKWDKLPIGTFSWLSFILTVAIFGFMHAMWINGIIAGIIFNLWLYYRKDIFSCIQCHASANLFLIIYVLITADWFLW